MIHELSNFGEIYYKVSKKGFPQLAFSSKEEAELALDLFKQSKSKEEIIKHINYEFN